MSVKDDKMVMVQVTVNAPIDKVWKFWTKAEHITQWNNASDDWHTPRAKNDLQKGGKFIYRMEAKDGSSGFDFEGVYDEVKINELISYTLGDSRKVSLTFKALDNLTTISERFEAETENSVELQRNGWQNILNNFKNYIETNS